MSDEETIEIRSYDEARILRRVSGILVESEETGIARAPRWAQRIASSAIDRWTRAVHDNGTSWVAGHVYVASFAIRTARKDLAARAAILAIVDAELDAREAVEAYLTSIGVEL